MIDPIYPDEFIAAYPRYANPATTKELVPGTYTVVLVSQVSISMPQAGRMNGYGSLTESMVTIPAMVVGDLPLPQTVPEPTVSAEKQIGGVELSYDELNGLPGAPEFFSGLHSLILQKYQAINNPTL